MWTLVTRRRPAACAKLIAAWRAVEHPPAVTVVIDGDLGDYDSVPWPAHWRVHATGAHVELIGAINHAVALYPDEPFYGLFGDYLRPRTMGWTDTLAEAAGAWNFSYCSDGWLNGKRADDPTRDHMSGCLCMGGALVRALGWVFPPSLIHLYGDDVLEYIGAALGLMRYRPDVRVALDRPETTGLPRDENRRRIFNGRYFADDDRRAFERMRDSGELDRLVEKVRLAMEGVHV